MPTREALRVGQACTWQTGKRSAMLRLAFALGVAAACTSVALATGKPSTSPGSRRTSKTALALGGSPDAGTLVVRVVVGEQLPPTR